MRIMLVHNHYQQRGGEDTIFEVEAALLAAHGHEVHRFTVHNDQIDTMRRVAVAAAAVWNVPLARRLRRHVREVRPQIVHFHNTFPLVSPAAYYAVKAEGVPVVQTLHNYRLACLNGLFFRDGHVCEDCLGRFVPWPGVRHRCYRDSRAGSATVAAMLATHRLLRTWQRQVDVFIAYSQFAHQRFLAMGLPPHKIRFKTNCLFPDPGPGDHHGDFGLYAGRLTAEKGVLTLLDACQQVGNRLPFVFVGDGPLAPVVAEAAAQHAHITWAGPQPSEEVYRLMGQARLLVVPSQWYETFGRVVIEGFARQTPVITSDFGAVAELVEPGVNGLRFKAGDAADLARVLLYALEHPDAMADLAAAGRATFEAHYSAEPNYKALLAIYEAAGAKVDGGHAPP